MDHSVKIRTQIANNEQIKKQDKLDHLEEGRKVRENIENERTKVKDIKAAKLDELKVSGINDKYLYDLQKKTIDDKIARKLEADLGARGFGQGLTTVGMC